MDKVVPRKRFGQHFLKDNQVIEKIVSSFSPTSKDTVVEIGPGTGVLTEKLLGYLDHLFVVELDRDLANRLLARYDSSALTVIQQDILKFNFQDLNVSPNKKFRVIGNLPYNISTPLIFHLIQNIGQIQDMHFMLQKEVAERLSAAPGSRHYGRLTVMSNLWLNCECLFNVGPESFHPPPKVDSTVLSLKPVDKPLLPKDTNRFNTMVRKAFSHRRKTLKNSLKDYLTESQFYTAGIDPTLRAEMLSVSDFIKLADS